MRSDVDTHRRKLLLSAGAVLGVGAMTVAARAAEKAPPGAAFHEVAEDPTKELGRAVLSDGGYGLRSQFETEVKTIFPNPSPITSWSFTPLASQIGNLTPSGLHFERHHGGVPTIDPAKHELIVHGHVGVAKKFTMADLKAMPSVTRKHFIECSGNTLTEWKKPTAKNVQVTHGLLSTSEWTGVLFSTLAREVGLKPDAQWVLGEGADAAVMTRSVPLEKMLTDGMIVYGQNGEAIRPEQGYPLRLVLPGYEGNTHIKWLRRLQVSDRPFMTKEETSKYTDLMPDGRAKLFTLQMAPKSVITFPSGDMMLPRPGAYEIRGIAWSGHGRVKSVEVSADGGRSWRPANIENTPEPMCTVRFSCPWIWDGAGATLQSRCTDETGAAQPTRDELVKVVGLNSVYHYNAIQSWAVASDGGVTNVHA
ncbi:sulfite dehydrogenase [Methylopila henanensis]|uniref:Sulfite dehydrogenase n=1 Tax=Methylopila henanensis TaxID=873516 RepID=A0ABW4KCH3_9HYPH